jgi:hypothetical protein
MPRIWTDFSELLRKSLFLEELNPVWKLIEAPKQDLRSKSKIRLNPLNP